LRVLHTPRDFGAEHLGDLHGERADAARSANDQQLLPAREHRYVAQCVERGEPGSGEHGRLFEVELGRLARQLVFAREQTHSDTTRTA
jgi:hypothetical protein